MSVHALAQKTFPRIETVRTLGWAPIDISLVDLPPHEDPDPVSDNFVLCLGVRGTVSADFDFGDGWRKALVPPGTFMPITPPGTLGKLRMDTHHRHLVVGLPMRAVSAVDGNMANFDYLHEKTFRDPLIAQLCTGLWTEAKSGNAMGELYADCLRAALVVALRRRSKDGPDARKRTHTFSRLQWRHIETTIHAHIGGELTVAMLAVPTGMPETRFLRAFRAQTGMTPYRYVLQKRIERAKTLLSDRKLSLVEIALATGFANQAHMTSAFTRVLGRTPGEIRRSLH